MKIAKKKIIYSRKIFYNIFGQIQYSKGLVSNKYKNFFEYSKRVKY